MKEMEEELRDRLMESGGVCKKKEKRMIASKSKIEPFENGESESEICLGIEKLEGA